MLKITMPFKRFARALIVAVVVTFASSILAATSIDAVNKYAYGANVGWIDCRGDTNNGAVIGEYYCSGYIYSANVGWINLGSGSPANQIQYQNNSATDFGVNQDGAGNLRGYAYGANIGWIAFESLGAPTVNLFSGALSGYVYSANCGWISLSNSAAVVQTDFILKAPLGTNGLPIAWSLQNFGTTSVNPKADADGDGVSNGNEYLAGTDPNNAASVLKITSVKRSASATTLTWTAVTSRFYTVQTNNFLNTGTWNDFTSQNLAGWNSVSFSDTVVPNRFYRIRAYRPLLQ